MISRVGAGALFRTWLDPVNPAARSWDLHLSCYEDDPSPFDNRPADVTLSMEKGPKMIGTADFLDKADRYLARPLESYDRVWLIDDDIRMQPAAMEAFLAFVEACRLDIAQPAVDPRSYYAVPITVRHRNALMRFTNFVEIMCPCYSRRALALCRPYFRANMSGWGVDTLSTALLGNPKRGIAIVDATPMLHTRPVRSGAHYRLPGLGDPLAEFSDLVNMFSLDWERRNWAALRPDGVITEDLAGVTQMLPGDPWP